MLVACREFHSLNLVRNDPTHIGLVVFCIGSAFQCGASSLSHIFIGRAVGGVGVGALR